MSLSPYLAQLLETYDLERLQTLLNWLGADRREQLENFPMQDKEPISMNTMRFNHSNLIPFRKPTTPLQELVVISILDEFGPQFLGKPSFQWLSRNVSQRFAPRSNAS